MAFHQPLQQRANRVGTENRDSLDLAPQIRSGPDESQTWVLFSPATDAGTTTSYLSSVEEARPTPGRSRISDLGSLDTVARSDVNSQPKNSAAASDFLDEGIAEDDAELDSLDSHLPEFRAAASPYSNQQAFLDATPVVPGHDGLGSFGLDVQGISAEAQERLYAFEQYNPRRIKRRRESLDLGQLELENGGVHDSDRIGRIEAWRLEQSQLLLDQIMKETRKRRQSETSQRPSLARGGAATENSAPAGTADRPWSDLSAAGEDWHEQDPAPDLSDIQQEGTWNRITRRLIRDLMGIDERLLSILLGETLPEDDDLSSTPKASAHVPSASPLAQDQVESSDDSGWQLSILGRIARELGLLVHQISTHHPGAFSTYQRVQQTPLPYAGLPVIPETTADAAASAGRAPEESTQSLLQFQPTVAHPLDIPGARPSEPLNPVMQATLDDLASRHAAPETFTQQEWEQDLDIKLVFRYLRSRFSSSKSSPPFHSGTSHLATSSTQDAAAKAARIRQHHPLVSHSSHPHSHQHQRSRPTERRNFKAVTPGSPVAIRHHRSGSCASQSTRQSARRSSLSSRHSSRHYWDIGGSIGTGSMIASTGPMGSWGDL